MARYGWRTASGSGTFSSSVHTGPNLRLFTFTHSQFTVTELVTAALTALFGVFVFVLGQAAQRFLVEPIQDQRKAIGEVAFALLMFANVAEVAQVQAQRLTVLYPADPEEVVRTLRTLAARLQQSRHLIPAYGLLSKLRVVPSQERVSRAIDGLVGWSNSIHSGNPGPHREAVAAALNLQVN